MPASKETLRKELKSRLRAVPPEEYRSQGEKAAAVLGASSIWAGYNAVFLFLSMNSEIETQLILEMALAEGKRVFAPRVEGENIVFCPILSAQGPWLSGPFGIKEPLYTPGAPGVPAQAQGEHFPALVLTPGLAFDKSGRRLGRGRGYYDRFFAELDAAERQYFPLGFCMDFQILDEVPVDDYDKRVQGILTCKELYVVQE